MQPEIVQREAFQVIGMPYVGKNENKEIPAMWGEFMRRAEEIPNVCADVAYGVCLMPDGLEPGAFEYVAGLQVSSIECVPDGMVARQIPAQTYAVFTVPSLADLMKAYDHITKEWLPASGYQPAGTPDFELYPGDFVPGVNERLFVYFPVKKG